NVALDPRVADLSTREPELVWLIAAIAGVVLDAVQVVRAFNEMRAAARALQEAGDIRQFTQVVTRSSLPDAAKTQVIARASRQAGVSASVNRTIEAVGTAFRRTDINAVAEQVEQIAGRGFRRVVDELRANEKLHPLTQDTLESVLGEQRAAQWIAANPQWRRY